MKHAQAEIVQEYGPFPGAPRVHGVTFDGSLVWFATDDRLLALNAETGEMVRTLDVKADAGTAFDGKHLFQIADGRIQKLDLASGEVLSVIPAPGKGDDSGLAWAEGSLWVGQYEGRKIYQIDPETGDILRTIESTRMVTGVTWVNGALWHGTWENDESDVRRVNPDTGEVMDVLAMPAGTGVSGLEAGRDGQFFCGGGASGKLRVVHRSK